MEDLEDVCVDETDKVGRLFMALFHEVWSCFAELSRNVALGLRKRISQTTLLPEVFLPSELRDDGDFGSGPASSSR